MPTQLTDEQLTKKLEESFLPFDQKLEIAPLIPIMNEAERKELLGLIEQSEEIEDDRKDFEEQYHQDLAVLNEQYTQKMDQLAATNATKARKEFEKMTSETEEKELEELENELNDIQP